MQLRLSYPAITPGYHLNKRHWNTVVLDGSVPDELVLELVVIPDKGGQYNNRALRPFAAFSVCEWSFQN